MVTDNIILINKDISCSFLPSNQPMRDQIKHVDFSDYKNIYKLLCTTNTKKLKIYDTTHLHHTPPHTIVPINDHINRIGNNPFIGQQKNFNIEFINVEQIYTQNEKGVITTSYGNRYQQYKQQKEFSSTHIANIAVLAHIQSYEVRGYLVSEP